MIIKLGGGNSTSVSGLGEGVRIEGVNKYLLLESRAAIRTKEKDAL